MFIRASSICLVIGLAACTHTGTPPQKDLVRAPGSETNGVTTHYLSSKYVAGECRVRIIRPDEPTSRILFLLPVTPWPGFEEKWERLGSGFDEALKLDLANRFGYVIVVPDIPNHMPWFVDHATDVSRRHESYMMNVLVPFVDELLDIEEPRRDLVGFSKGGFASLSLLLRHPDVFHAASVWDPGGILKTFDPAKDTSLSNATGSQENFDHYQLSASIRRGWDHFVDSPRIAIAGYSNDAFLERLRALHESLDQEGVPHAHTEAVHVPHRWYTGWIDHALTALQAQKR